MTQPITTAEPAEPTPPPGVDAIREMTDRYIQAEQAYAIARAFGDQDSMARHLRAMTRRHQAVTRITLAVLDAQAAAQAVTR